MAWHYKTPLYQGPREPRVHEYGALDPYPPTLLTPAGVAEVAAIAAQEGRLGLDLEFNPETGKPHIIGVASQQRAAACWFDTGLAEGIISRAVSQNTALVGHSVMDADKPVIDGWLKITTPVELWDDSMLRGYLCNSDWCSAPGKTEDEDSKGSLGFMNLYTMASYYLGVPQWKRCRESACFGPCPRHDEPYYCAIDAWAGLRIADAAQKEMEQRGISEKLYQDLKSLTVYCGAMSRQGIKIDRDRVTELENTIQGKKSELFPTEMALRTPRCKKLTKQWLTPFNPNSPKQVAEYFEAAGLPLQKVKGSPTSKDAIRKTLEKALKLRRIPFELDKSLGSVHLAEDYEEPIPEALNWMLTLLDFKTSGKGLKSWFDEKYFDAEGFIHPRFVVPGTSSGRLASANPNFQNLPKRGFGSLVRTALVPRDRNLKFVRADKGQLELRICLFYAGAEQPPNDAFTWLVNKAQGKFDQAAARLSMKPRDVAKSVAHAANYLEGLMVLGDEELATPRRQAEIRDGALLVFDGKQGRALWEYRGGYVCFTGVNLADRIFADKGHKSRATALQIQEIYFSAFPQIREWHKSLSRRIETQHHVLTHTGRGLYLYGSPEEDLKLAAAVHGQGGGADEVQEGMLRFAYLGHTAVIQVHDELGFEVPADWTDDQVRKFFSTFCEPSQRFNGWRFPIEISQGMNYGTAGEQNPDGLRKLEKQLE